MARFVVLGGYGGMGKVAVYDLFHSGKDEVIVAGRDLGKARDYATSFNSPRVKGAAVDVTDVKATATLLKGADVCINAVQYYNNMHVMEACLRARVNYLDLGGLYHTTLKQLQLDSQFRAIKKVAILGCGSTPGTTNVMIHYGARLLDKVDEVSFRFGGVDKTKYNQPFVLPYSMQTVFDEFTEKAAVYERGKIRFVEPRKEFKDEWFPEPIHKAKCFHILHSELATIPQSLKKKGIKKCEFKACFDKEFVNLVSFLVDTGLASKEVIDVNGKKIVPRDLTVQLLNKFPPKEGTKIDDQEFLVAELIGKKKGKPIKLRVICKAVSTHNIPAGTWDTGTPPSIMAQMIASGLVKKKGVVGPEVAIDPELYFKELRKRSMHVYVEEEERVE